MRTSRGLRVFLPPVSRLNRRTAIREPRPYCHSLPLLHFPLDYRDLMRIYRQTTAKHRRSSRPTETGGKAEASRNCDTQIVKLIMPSVHGFFIDVDFLRNDTKRLLSESFFSCYATIFSSCSSSKPGPTGSN